MSLLLDIFSTDVSVSDLRNPALWLQDALLGRKTASGEYISPEGAMAISVYYACLRNISEDIGKLPLKVYRRLAPRGKRLADEHPVYNLLHDSPNPQMASMTFREMLTHWELGWGNGYAEIDRANSTVVALYPIHPSRVRPIRDKNTEGNPVFYEVKNGDGSQTLIKQDDMFHIRGMGDELSGYSVARFAAESLGMTLASQTFGASFFGNGAKVGGVLEHPGKLSEAAHQRVRETWATQYTGAENAGKTFLAEEGMTYKPIGIPPEEAQFLETRQFQVEEVARWFRMPPHKVGHLLRAVGWSTLEATNTDYVTDTLMPHFVRWEQEIRRKLFKPNEQDLFAEFVVSGLLRGDQAARSAFYRELFMIGVYSQNDIREKENENPIEDGDTYYVMTNLAATDEEPDAVQVPPPSAPPVLPDRPAQPDEDASARMKLAHMPIFVDVAERFARKEAKAQERAARRYGGNAGEYAQWADKFYRQHVADMVAGFQPSAHTLALILVQTRGGEVLPHGVGQAVDGALLDYMHGLLPWRDNGHEPPALALALTDLVAGTVLAQLEACNERN